MTRIFISHSHSDQAIAFRLVNFLLAGLRVEEEDIFCSSDPDQGLAYSANSITDQLKHQLRNSEAIIILITLDSLHSAWIPFEVGSFWTTDRLVIPILGTGLTQSNLPGPLKSFLSIAIETPDFADKLNSAINQLGDKLQIAQRFTTRRNHTLKEFCQHLKDWQPKY
ncbi:MAG: toll/interleukin-1 receptor domain-containing protein, partial [Cyanobacteria bacterium J06642_3]